MSLKHAITKTTAIVILVAVIVIATAGVITYNDMFHTSSKQEGYISTLPVTVGVINPIHPYTASFALPNVTQIFQQYDPNIKIEYFSSSGQVIHALESGTIQIGIAGSDAIMKADAEGASLVIIATYDLPPTLRYVVVSNSSDIYTLSQLNGTVAAESTPGSVDAVYAEYLAKSFDLNIKIEYVGSAQAQIASIISGKATFTNIAEFDDLKLIDTHELRIVYNLTLPWPNNVVVTTRSFATNSPSAVKAVLMGIFAIDKIYDTNPGNQVYNFLVKFYNNTLSPSNVYLLLKTLKFSTNGEINITQFELELETFKSVGVITNSSFSVNQMISSEFVKIVT